MNDKANIQPLLNHLCNTSRLSIDEAEKLVMEVITYFLETPGDFVKRRHRELKNDEGWSNEKIFKRIENEVAELVFSSPPLTKRQIRRIIYG